MDFPSSATEPMPDSHCEKPCSGDAHQYCGGETPDLLKIFVGTCEGSLIRFGENCFSFVSGIRGLQANADRSSADVR